MTGHHITFKRLLLIFVAVGAVLFSRLFIEYKISSQYQALVTTSEIVEAFLNDDGSEISRVAERYGLEYQKLQHEKVVASTSSVLPIPHIIPVHTAYARGVLKSNERENLTALVPISFFKKGRFYVGATLFPYSIDAPGYIVYTQVLP